MRCKSVNIYIKNDFFDNLKARIFIRAFVYDLNPTDRRGTCLRRSLPSAQP